MTVTVTYATQTIGGDDQVINTDTAGAQSLPDVLALSGGGFVSAYNSGSTTDGLIELDFYDAGRNHIGTFQTAYASGQASGSDALGQPKLSELANGKVLVVWADANLGASTENAGPRAAIFTAAGGAVAQDVDLINGIVGLQAIDAAALSGGGFAMAYTTGTGVFFRLYNDLGVQTLGFTEAGPGVDGQIVALSDGAFALSWTATSDTDIHYRIFEANGSARTANLSFSLNDDQSQSAIAATQDGGFVVAFTDTGWGSEAQGISLQLVDSTGLPGGAIQVTSNTAAAESDPDVTVLANGFIVVTWTYPFSAGDDDIYFRIYDPSLNAVTDAQVLADGTDLERNSAVDAFADGSFITAFTDASADGDGGGIASETIEVLRTGIGDGDDDTFVGDAFRDSLDGGFGDDSLGGGAHDDTLSGGADNDTLDGGKGFDFLFGGSGRDLLQGGLDGDTIQGDAGDDMIFGCDQADPGVSTIADSILGGDGDDKIRGSGGADTADGGNDDDKISGGEGDDHLAGGDGADKPKGQAGADTLEGGQGADTVNGGAGDDVLYAMTELDLAGSVDADYLNGAQGADTLYGSGGRDYLAGLTGKDSLVGGAGTDTLDGGSAKDVLVGGLGADVLNGGGDKDSFTYLDLTDSVAAAEDVILDLGNQDFVDLSAIDAKAGPGNQAFTLVSAFSGARGELVVSYETGGEYAGFTTIEGDVDGDGAADLIILVVGDRHNFSHFVL